jgi:O-methyltransferase domain/Dimerisation domain
MSEEKYGIGNVVPNTHLVDMAMGYSRSRVLCAAARLGVADALQDRARPVDEIAATCGADPGALYRLMRALASIGVVAESVPGTFVLTAFGQPLRKDAPNSVWPAVVFWADLLADNWSHLTECIRTGATAAQIMEHAGLTSRWAQDPDAGAVFRAVMGTAPAEVHMPIVTSWDFASRRVVADLGGGGGNLLAAILKTFPDLEGMLVDRPASVESAAPRVNAEGLASRCRLIVADLLDEVPPGADVYMLKHVLHGYDDDRAVRILANCRSAMAPESRLLVIEFLLPNVVSRADPNLERRLMSDLNMLAVTGGKERSEIEWQRLLDRSGFTLRRVIPVAGDLVSVIEAAPGGPQDD